MSRSHEFTHSIQGTGNWVASCRSTQNGTICIRRYIKAPPVCLAGVDPMVLERSGDLYKAPGKTQLKAGSCVRLPLDENVAPDAEERWYYGTVTRVYSGGELVDVKLDTGDECLCIPTWEVFSA